MQLLSSNGQLFELSDAAARQSFTLQGAEEVGDDAVPVPFDSGRLQRITALLEQTAVVYGLEGMTDERRDALLKNGLPRGDMGPQLRAATAAVLEGVDGVADFATLLLDLKWFDAQLLTSVLAEGVARLLSGKSADALRTLLEANGDLGDEEKEAALREPLFAPPAVAPDNDAAAPAAAPAAAVPPPLARSVSLAMDEGAEDEGNMTACLQRCDARTLRQLKAVSAGWQQRARRELLYRVDAARHALGIIDAEELDVEELSHLGLLHEAVAAVRSMSNLARLRGYGFRVELNGPQGVRQVALGGADRSGPLGGMALRGCIHEGEGEPPHELLLAAVACAARGTVRGVPVQQLREDDAIGSLNLDGERLGVIEAELLGIMLPAATSLRELSLSNQQLCGLDYDGHGTYTAEGITKLCEGLKGSAVTSLNLRGNVLGPEGAATLAEGLKGNSTLQLLRLSGSNLTNNGRDVSGLVKLVEVLPQTKIESVNFAKTALCGLDSYGKGTYTADAITKLCEGLKGSSMTSLNVAQNKIKGDAAENLATVVLEHAIMTDFCGIPLVSLRENSITELDLRGKSVGVPGAIVLSKLLPSAVALRSLNLADNQLCGVDSDGYGTYTAEGINKLCDGLKGSAVTLLNLQGNYIGAIGAFALAAFLKETPITELDVGSNHLTWSPGGNIMSGLLKLVQILPQTKIESLGIGSNRIGDKGASALAAILKETKITTLGLGDNNIGGQYDKKCQFVSNTEGIIALCEGLKGSSVTSLDLAHSALCNEAKQALEDAAGSSLRISF